MGRLRNLYHDLIAAGKIRNAAHRFGEEGKIQKRNSYSIQSLLPYFKSGVNKY